MLIKMFQPMKVHAFLSNYRLEITPGSPALLLDVTGQRNVSAPFIPSTSGHSTYHKIAAENCKVPASAPSLGTSGSLSLGNMSVQIIAHVSSRFPCP